MAADKFLCLTLPLDGCFSVGEARGSSAQTKIKAVPPLLLIS
jgi:hypothetical protein